MVKIFLAYIFLFHDGQAVGSLRMNEVFRDYPSCVAALNEKAPSVAKEALVDGLIITTKCVEVDVPQEVKAGD